MATYNVRIDDQTVYPANPPLQPVGFVEAMVHFTNTVDEIDAFDGRIQFDGTAGDLSAKAAAFLAARAAPDPETAPGFTFSVDG